MEASIMNWWWYWRIKKKHVSRTLCSKLTSIDSFKIYKKGPTHGFTVHPLEIKAIPMDNHLKISYSKQKEHSYTIPIDKLSCNYGGFRYYFRCPLCQKRMRMLYFAEKSIFLCRKCLNLGYEVQRMRPTKRYEYMSKKVKGYIKDKGGTFEGYKKPPRMHKEKYDALWEKCFYYDQKSRDAENEELREWHGPKVEPFLDHVDYIDESKPWRKNKAHLTRNRPRPILC